MRVYGLMLVLLAVNLQGCTLDRWAAFYECRAERLRAQQEALEVSTADCRSERLRDSEELRSQYDESLKTQLGIPLSQQLVLGQLQVDEAKLAELLEKRKKDQEALKSFYDKYDQERQQREHLKLQNALQEALKNNDHAAAERAIANCCRPRPTCAGAEEQQFQPTVPEELKQPLLPTEIPFILPVSVRVNMGAAQIGPTRVERLKKPEPEEQKYKPCCPTSPCGCCDTCAPQNKAAFVPSPLIYARDKESNAGLELLPPFSDDYRDDQVGLQLDQSRIR